MDKSLIKHSYKLTLNAAQQIITKGIELAQEKKLNLAIAITDNSGVLINFIRMDDASLVTVEVAIQKAKSAAYLNAPSKLFEDFINDGAMSMLSTPNILPLQGGMPIYYEDNLIGAIGISGSNGDTDQSIAKILASYLN
ncbi:heme-binding protein [Chishuiella sp.]|uniref:GlcG/HbpS family heme-binding protein n=1 Tax=Chishuiella sp. TaxID=1969467 RepID=UPI0028A88FAE|nr:heme-binding protein [Chishuiella sp.]